MSVKTLIYVKAKPDVNGNPRRGWIITWMDNLFIPEGYSGRWSLYGALGWAGPSEISASQRLTFDQSVNEITLDIPASQYNHLKRGK
jgi:hypothetical protein